MNRKIPVILFITVLLAGLVSADSLQYSEKLRLGQKKIFRAYRDEIGGLKARHTRHFRFPKRMMPSSAIVYTYNDDHLITGIKLPKDSQITYKYYTDVPRRSQGNLWEVKSSGSDSFGSPPISTIYEYENYYNQVTKITDPKGNETVIKPGSNGNPDTVTLPGIPDYDYDYNTYGQLVKVTDPTKSITEYFYYPESSPSGDGPATSGSRSLDSKDGGYLREVIIDSNGDKITEEYKYDALGNITNREDGKGVETTYEYDKDGNTTGSTLSGHNPYGEVSKVIQGKSNDVGGGEEDQSIGLETTFKYDLNGNVLEQNSRGITTKNEYDRLNRLRFVTNSGTSEAGPATQTYEYRYDDNSNLRYIIYPRDGIQDEFTYDNRDLPETKILGTGKTTESYTYTPNGYINTYTDGDNKTYTYKHDCHGRLREVIDPLGNKVKSGYDDNSNVTSVEGIGVDGKTHRQDFVFDNLNRMTDHKVTKDSGEIKTHLDYILGERKITTTNPNNQQWNMTLTGAGLTDTVIDPIGNIDTSKYDARGWIESLTESEPANADGTPGKSLTRNFSHNVLGNPFLRGDSIKRDYKHYYHQGNQQIKEIFDPLGGAVEYKQDGLNRLWKETRKIKYQGIEKAADTTYTYDANGNLETIKDAGGNVTTYKYDEKDRLTDIFYPGTTNEHITYNGRDQVLTYKDLNGTEIINTYDDAGRLTDKTVTPGAGVEGPYNEHFEYDGLNRLTLTSNSDSEVRFTYDQAGRVERETQIIKDGGNIATYYVGFGHDDNGNKTQITYPSNKVVTITPDALDRIDTIKDNIETIPIVDYTYEGKGKITRKEYINGVTMEASFDDGRRPKNISYKNNHIQVGLATLIEKGMGWDLVDLKTTDRENGAEEKYLYDSAYRMRNVDNQGDKVQYDYELDGLENPKTITETKNGAVEAKNAVPNARNQLVSFDGKPLAYDNNGNMTGFDKAGYKYNWKNQLVKASTGAGVNVEYKYDALGRRIVKIVKDAKSQEITHYVHDGYQVIEEHKVGESNTLEYRYTYGNGIDERIEMEKRVEKDGKVEYKRYYPHYDSIGNTIGLTNSRGLLIERYKYNPYGKVKFYNTENSPKVYNITIRDGKIRLYLDRLVDKNNLIIQVVQKEDQLSIPIQIESTPYSRRFILIPAPDQLPQNKPLNITVGEKEETSGSIGQDQVIQLLSQDFVYQGGPVEVIHDEGPPHVERVTNEGDEITVEFNEDVKPSSLTGHIELTYAGTAISGQIVMVGDNEAKFISDEPLSDTRQYSVRVWDAEDYAGKAIEVFSLDFKTNTETKFLFYYSILTESSHSIVGNNSLMHGRDYEPETGLYYYRYRYYHPELGRFLQPDPMGYEDSMNLYQGFNMNPANFTDPYGELIKAEYGKHDVFSTQEVKTGKWYLDYTVVGMFNEVRNACALGVNLGSNLLGGTDDLAFEAGDYALYKAGVIERGELRDDQYMRDMVSAVLLANPNALANGTKTAMNKLDDLTLKLYQLVKSKGGKVLDVRKNVMVVADANLLNTDDLSKVFAGNGRTINSLDDIPIMSTDEVKDALTASGNYKKGTDWAFSIHDHHFNPKWLGGKEDGPILRLRGFEHITDLEPELFEYVKKQIPAISRKSPELIKYLLRKGLVTKERITGVLYKFYKSRYPNLDDASILNALKGEI